MNIKSVVTFSIIGISLLACDNEKKSFSNDNSDIVKEEIKEEPTEAEKWVSEAINAHGGEQYKTAHFQFVFRGDYYQFKNDGDHFYYQKKVASNLGEEQITHIIENGDYTYLVNNKEKELDLKQTEIFKEALNSVIYFVTLPSKLSDPAVIIDHKGETFINDTAYQLIVIQFKKENGGKDFEDQYLYWINHETKEVDYLAYSYKDDKGGGTRFRKAYNKRKVDGIIFQDYINYKGEPGIDLYILAEQYEKRELEELSRIETENVKSLK